LHYKKVGHQKHTGDTKMLDRRNMTPKEIIDKINHPSNPGVGINKIHELNEWMISRGFVKKSELVKDSRFMSGEDSSRIALFAEYYGNKYGWR